MAIDEIAVGFLRLVGRLLFEIFVDTPLEVCEERDPKGLYEKARAGDIKNFTGIDSPYELPENADITIDTTALTPDAAAEHVVAVLRDRRLID